LYTHSVPCKDAECVRLPEGSLRLVY